MAFKIRSHCVERAAIWVNVGVEWICRNGIYTCNLYRWNLLLQVQNMSINYHSLLKWFQILIN